MHFILPRERKNRFSCRMPSPDLLEKFHFASPVHAGILSSGVLQVGQISPSRWARTQHQTQVQQGESEMGTYARVEGADGSVRLVKRNTTLVKPGQVQVYLPGDIHDTL